MGLEISELDFLFQCKMGGDFSQERLVGLELEGLEFDSVDVGAAFMQDCAFKNCKLTNFNFEMTDFSSVVFDNCDLTGSSFDGAGGENLKFIESTLVGCTFDDADIVGVRMYGCQGPIDLADATLIGSSITYSNLELSDFSGTRLQDVLFEGNDMESIIVTMRTRLEGATKFYNCDVTAVQLSCVRGFGEDTLEDCTAWPFALAGMQALSDFYGATDPWEEEDTQPGVNLSIYGGVDKSAHLYCSDMEEYKRCL